MAITLVATVSAAPGPNGGATAAMNSTGATLLVLSMSYFSTVPTVTDAKSNTWTHLTPQAAPGGSYHRLSYVAVPVVGSGHTVTVAGSSIYPALVVYAFAGTEPVSPVDIVGGTGGTGTSASVTYAIPSRHGSLLVSGMLLETVSSVTNSAGLTQTVIPFGSGNNFAAAVGYGVQGTAAALPVTWSWTTSSNYAQTGAFFKPAAAAAVATADSYVWGPL